MRITNTNTVFTGLKYAEHMTVNTPMPCMYNISLNVQYQIECAKFGGYIRQT